MAQKQRSTPDKPGVKTKKSTGSGAENIDVGDILNELDTSIESAKKSQAAKTKAKQESRGCSC